MPRFDKTVKYQSWHGYLFFAVVFIAAILAVTQKFGPEPVVVPEPEVMSLETCEASGGVWNSCGSACRGSDEVCIEVCVVQCECATSDECPVGFVCSDLIDNIGICSKLSQ